MDNVRNFLKDEWGGVITTEYVILVIGILIVLIFGVAALGGGMRNLFGAYSIFFTTGS